MSDVRIMNDSELLYQNKYLFDLDATKKISGPREVIHGILGYFNTPLSPKIRYCSGVSSCGREIRETKNELRTHSFHKAGIYCAGSELSSDSWKFPNVTKGCSKFFEVARRISVSLLLNYISVCGI